MDKLFNVIFLDEAFEFLKSLDKKHYEKIKVPDNEILKAKQSRVKYFEDKERSKDKKK
jgi:mRNA-degrading endonuclease RelE of RelBE toxin-antitoxin system